MRQLMHLCQYKMLQSKHYMFSNYTAWPAEWVNYVFTSVQYWNAYAKTLVEKSYKYICHGQLWARIISQYSVAFTTWR